MAALALTKQRLAAAPPPPPPGPRSTRTHSFYTIDISVKLEVISNTDHGRILQDSKYKRSRADKKSLEGKGVCKLKSSNTTKKIAILAFNVAFNDSYGTSIKKLILYLIFVSLYKKLARSVV